MKKVFEGKGSNHLCQMLPRIQRAAMSSYFVTETNKDQEDALCIQDPCCLSMGYVKTPSQQHGSIHPLEVAWRD